jgi:ferredoxin-type protein NapH
MTQHRAIILWALLLIFAVAPAALSQGFGTPSPAFGESETADREFTTSDAAVEDAKSESSTFIHDQLLKLLLVLAFSLAGLAIIWTRRFFLRRWLLIASVVVLGFVVGGMLCPIAAVQNIILKASTGYLLLFLVPTVSALFVGRLFCGYVCPFGALQELVHVKRFRWSIPSRWMRVLRWIPYGLLGYLVVRVLATGILTWGEGTPFKAFFTFGGTPATLILSGVFVLLSIVLFRPFCRLFCPLGAWLSLVSRLSPFRIRESSACVSCSCCDEVCASEAITNGKVKPEDCLLCGECISICPTDALSVCGKCENSAD